MRKENFGLMMKILTPAFCLSLAVGCSNSSGDKAKQEQVRIASVSEEVARCEAQIRQKMDEKAITLQLVDDFKSEILGSNSLLEKSEEKEYSAMQVKGKTVEIEMAHLNKKGLNSKFEYSLSIPDKDTDGILSLSVEAETKTGDLVTSVSQTQLVDRDCNLRVTETSLETIKKVRPGQYRYFSKEVFLSGEPEIEEKVFSVMPNQEPLMNFSYEDDVEKLPKQFYQYEPSFGIAEGRIERVADREIKEFDLNLKLKSYAIILKASGQELPVTYGTDDSNGIKVSEVGDQKTWLLPKEVWKNLALGSSDSLQTYVKYTLSQKYLVDHNKIVLISQKPIDYDHFGAYFKIIKQEKGSDGSLSYTLQENPNPTVKGSAVSADLESNDTIQTKLPEIQNIARYIKGLAPVSRPDQIQLILDHLKSNYTYDYEMLKNNVIRPLTTQQALARKKGVCQHYSVLFTAIARALGIPTRIVFGYLLGDTAGGHAWIEAEVAAGTWQVIEPQSANSLKQMNTRFYLPVDRARFLEDKDVTGAAFEAGMKLYNQKWEIKPVP